MVRRAAQRYGTVGAMLAGGMVAFDRILGRKPKEQPAVVIEAAHQCMTTRGVHKSDVTMVTSRMLGAFRNNGETRREFLTMIGRSSI